MQAPDVVVVGSATRDLSEHDPRGWMLGGGVTFGALALARLGLRTGVVLGLDAEAATARELDLIRDAGAEIVEVPLANGPVFTNVETLAGRIQTCGSLSDAVPVEALPAGWEAAPAWVFAPIASELPDDWIDVPAAEACVAFAWQGILRNLAPGERVTPKQPGPSPFLERADVLAFSRHDVPGELQLRDLGAWLGDECDVLLTAGLLGGMLIRFRGGRITRARAYPSIPSLAEIDPTGAGDTMLAGLVAARLVAGDEAELGGRDVYMGAAASSLLVEGPGMNSVPTYAQLLARVDRRG
jgi:sugar/nucleoside kinase (ribokinase family)